MHRFAPLRRAVLALALVAALTGCDSSDAESEDRELIVGTWTAVSLQDDAENRTEELEALGTLSLEFEADESLTIGFDPVAGESETIDGTYEFAGGNEITFRLTFPEVPGQTVGVNAAYRLQGDELLELTFDEQYALLFDRILGSGVPDFEGDIDLVFERD